MRRVFIGIVAFIMAHAFALPHSFADWRQQARAMSDQMKRSEPQDLAKATVGVPVQDLQGNIVGQVVALATRENEAAYFLVALNGSEGELIPIPFTAARFDPQANAVILQDVADPELAQVPTARREESQRPGDPESDRDFRSYYGQEPVQEDETSQSMNSEGAMGAPEVNI